jgi:PQQ-like domain
MNVITLTSRHMAARWNYLAGLLCVVAAMSACSSGSSAIMPSALNNTSVLTCPRGHRDCTAAGTVRWSLPVSGGYGLGGGMGVLDVPVVGDVRFSDPGPPDGAHGAAFTGGVAVVCAGGFAEAIDPASGHVLWRQKFAAANGADSANADSQGPCDLTVVAPGQVAAADFNDFPSSAAPDYVRILSTATGAVGPRLVLPLPPGANNPDPNAADASILALSGGTLSVLVNSQVYGLNDVSGAVRWKAALRSFSGDAVVGDILYADTSNDTGSVTTALQHVDLSSGAVLTPLPLGTGLKGTDLAVMGASAVAAAAGPVGTLLVGTGTTTRGNGRIAAVDPGTGQALWSYPGNLVRMDPGSQPPEAAVVQESLPPSASSRGALTLRIVNLATGQLVATSGVPYRLWRAISLNPGNDGEAWWNFYASALVAEVQPDSSQAGTDASLYGRLEGVTASGKVRWRGPWSSGDLWVLGDSTAGPPLIIVESCTPAGIVPPATPPSSGEVTTTCTQGRLYAINV